MPGFIVTYNRRAPRKRQIRHVNLSPQLPCIQLRRHVPFHLPFPLLPNTFSCPIPPLWSITVKNKNCSTGPLARPFARSLVPLTRLLAPDCSLYSRPPLHSLIRSLPHFSHSFARRTVNDLMAILAVFFTFSTIVHQRAPSSHSRLYRSADIYIPNWTDVGHGGGSG